MLAPSGDQYEISAAGYRAVITESGAALRELAYAGRPLVDGFGADEMSPGTSAAIGLRRCPPSTETA